MKTLFKTITVVSLATLTAVGTTKFSKPLLTQQTDNIGTLDIYSPSEKNAVLEFAQPVSFKETNLNQLSADLSLNAGRDDRTIDLNKAIQFAPQSSFDSEINAASTLSVGQLIKFEPAEIDENEATLNSTIAFSPVEIVDQEILEPISIDQLIKFNPSVIAETVVEPADYETAIAQLIHFKPLVINNETIVEPAATDEKIAQLIHFRPMAINEEIVEPVSSLDQLIKFSPNAVFDNDINESVISDSNCNTELMTK